MRAMRLVAAAIAVLVSINAAFAADLGGYYGGSCTLAQQSNILTLPAEEIEPLVHEYFEEARATLKEDSVIYSRRPAFVWAGEARFQCGKAAGYFGTGHLDEESVQKCDCFYRRMISYR